MAKNKLPVYDIAYFRRSNGETDIYANVIRAHLKKHSFITKPHKHDFFATMIFTKGSGVHEIDFSSYAVKPGAVFMLSPGQAHTWELSDDIDGYIFFHTGDFFNVYFAQSRVEDYPFFQSFHAPPVIYLRNHILLQTEKLFAAIYNEYAASQPLKFDKIRSLINLVYIELSRMYQPFREQKQKNPLYLARLRQFEQLLDRHYKTVKSPAEYAQMMSMSEKHLNRICKECLNKTTTDMILGRVILEAKRLLKLSDLSITEVADQLGYYDSSYFTRLFRQRTGTTPAAFAKKDN